MHILAIGSALYGGTNGVCTSFSGSVASSAGFLESIIFLVVTLVGLGIFFVVGFFFMLMISMRPDADKSGQRSETIFTVSGCFVGLFVGIMGIEIVVSGLDQYIGAHSSCVGHSVASAVVIGIIMAVVGLGICSRMIARIRTLCADRTAGKLRVARTYVALVHFLALIEIMGGAIASLFIMVILIDPGLFGLPGRPTELYKLLIPALFQVGIGLAVRWFHASLVTPPFGGFGRGPGHQGGSFAPGPQPWSGSDPYAQNPQTVSRQTPHATIQIPSFANPGAVGTPQAATPGPQAYAQPAQIYAQQQQVYAQAQPVYAQAGTAPIQNGHPAPLPQHPSY